MSLPCEPRKVAGYTLLGKENRHEVKSMTKEFYLLLQGLVSLRVMKRILTPSAQAVELSIVRCNKNPVSSLKCDTRSSSL